MSFRPRAAGGGDPTRGFVTESGFGVCENGAIGFAEDVDPSLCSKSIPDPGSAASNQLSAAAASVQQQQQQQQQQQGQVGTTLKAEKKAEAVNYYRPVLRNMAEGSSSSSSSSEEEPYCQCDTEAKPTMTRKILNPTPAQMNALVFKSITGKEYSRLAAREHKVVDIFGSFPHGVPTNKKMDKKTILKANSINRGLMKAREDVRNCLIMGKHLNNNQLKNIHSISENLKELAKDDKLTGPQRQDVEGWAENLEGIYNKHGKNVRVRASLEKKSQKDLISILKGNYKDNKKDRKPDNKMYYGIAKDILKKKFNMSEKDIKDLLPGL